MIVRSEEYLKVLVYMDIGSRALWISSGVRLEEIEEMVFWFKEERKQGEASARIVVKTKGGSHMNLNVQGNLIEWD